MLSIAAVPLALALQTLPGQHPGPLPYPPRVNQPRQRDPGLHGVLPGVAGSGDIVVDGRVAVISRFHVDPVTLVTTRALMAVTLDPDRIQTDADGNLTEFQDAVHPIPGLPFYGDDFAFSGYDEAFLMEELPDGDPTVSPPPTPPVTPGGNLSSPTGFSPLALALKPLPKTGPSFGENPYPADASGQFDLEGTFRKYELWMVAVHYPWIWEPVAGEWIHDTTVDPPWLGGRDVTILVDEGSSPPVVVSAVAGTFQPLTIGGGATPVYGHEPTITGDGRLILFHGDGGDNAPAGPGNPWGMVTYVFNQDPCSASGWSAPRSLSDMYWVEADEGGPFYAPTTVAPPGASSALFRDVYTLARHPLKEPDGSKVYQHGDDLVGPYPWVDKDGSFVMAMHNQTYEAPPGAQAVRAGMYVAGAITQGYLKHVDDPALNPTRAGGAMEWPVDGNGTWIGRHSNRLITTSTGLKPGPWELQRDADVPVPTQPADRRVPVLPVFSFNLDMYGEVRFEEADGGYLLYLACNEGFRPWSGNPSLLWEADPTFTPDTSGREPRCTPVLEDGAAFPQEVAGGTAALRALTGIAPGTGDENVGFKGQALLFPTGGRVRVDGCGFDPKRLTVQAFVKVLPGWDGPSKLFVVRDPGRFDLRIKRTGAVKGVVFLDDGSVQQVTSVVGWFTPEPDPWDDRVGWRHVAMTYDGGGDQSVLTVHVDGEPIMTKTFPPSAMPDPVLPRSVFVGPALAEGDTDPTNPVVVLDEVAISDVVRTEEELRRDAYVAPAEGPFGPWPAGIALPLGLDPADAKWPAAEPYDPLVPLLGQALFVDPLLSGTGTSAPAWGGVSCATCHEPGHAFAEDQALASAFGGGSLALNTPTLLNAAFGERKFFDGRAALLEEQPGFTIPGAGEMNLPLAEAVARLNDPANVMPIFGLPWPTGFDVVFGEPADEENLARALAAYVRTLNSGDSPFDRDAAVRAGALTGEDPLTAAEKHGRSLFFGKARCAGCHSDSALSDDDFHNVLSVDATGSVLGHAGFTGRPGDLGLLKAPTLRNVALSGPWFHDGQAASLAEVVQHYDRGGGRADGHRPLGEGDRDLRPLLLTQEERDDLEAFLGALTGTSP